MKIAIQFTDHDEYDAMLPTLVQVATAIMEPGNEAAVITLLKIVRKLLEGEIVEA